MVGYSGTSAQPQKSACTLRLRRDSPLSMPNRTPAVKQCSGWSPATLTFQVVYLHDESSTVWVGHSHTLNLYCTAEMNCAIIRTFNERLMQCIFFFKIHASLPQSNPICNSSSHFSHITNTYIIREVDKSPQGI